MSARPLPVGFAPYVWASTAEEVAARRGLDPAKVIRFDANVPPLPGVPRIPIGESFARLNEYPEGTYRELREAAAAYVGVQLRQIVVGAGETRFPPRAPSLESRAPRAVAPPGEARLRRS